MRSIISILQNQDSVRGLPCHLKSEQRRVALKSSRVPTAAPNYLALKTNKKQWSRASLVAQWLRASLVAQWLRIRLPIQGTQV